MYAYLHIPFCKSKCSYCDFYSVVSSELADVHSLEIKNNKTNAYVNDDYISALLAEAEYRVKKHSITHWSSLYFGGGTPILLTKEQVHTLMNGLLQLCPLNDNAEVTFEVNPFEVAQHGGEEYIHSISDYGINRISCGIQALDDTVLNYVHRRSNTIECLQALKILSRWKSNKNNGISKGSRLFQFSVDIIAGLPKQSHKSFIDGLHTIASYNPDHISLYSLILEESTPLYKEIERNKMHYDYDNSDRMWLSGKELLKDYNYYQYEVSNFAKSSSTHLFESEHNRAYWNMKNYIGLGSGACGTVDNMRYTGKKDILKYCHFWNSYNYENTLDVSEVSDIETLLREDQIIEFLMMGFRTLKGVSASDFYTRFNESLEDVIGGVFSKWAQKNLAKKNGDYYSLTEQGLLYHNSFISEII